MGRCLTPQIDRPKCDVRVMLRLDDCHVIKSAKIKRCVHSSLKVDVRPLRHHWSQGPVWQKSPWLGRDAAGDSLRILPGTGQPLLRAGMGGLPSGRIDPPRAGPCDSCPQVSERGARPGIYPDA
jgi:hypothetical protein